MNPTYWFIVVLLTVVLWLKVNQWAFDDLMSPFNLLLPAWILPLMLKLLSLSRAERPWEPMTLFLITWVTVALTVTSLVASLFLPRRKSASWDHVLGKAIELLSRRSFSVYLVLCFAGGAVALVYNEFDTNPVGIPMFTYLNNPDISRDPNWQWKGESLWPLSVPAFTLTPLLYLKFRIVKGWCAKAWYLGLALFYPAVELLKMARSEVIYGLTGIVMMEYYYRKRMNAKVRKPPMDLKNKVRAIVLAALVGFLALVSANQFQQIRATRPMSTFANSLGMEVDLSGPYASMVVEFYAYFALPFENFSNFVNNYSPTAKPGVGGLRPFYSALGMGNVARGRIKEVDFDKYLEILPVNTYPFVVSLYAEFGWLGTMVFPVIYAGALGFLYVRFRSRSRIETMVLYVIFLSYCWVWIFSNQNFTGAQYYLYAVIIYPLMLVYRLIVRRRARTGLRAPGGPNELGSRFAT